jgi:aminoglycoside phosphotransferase (APT) family kinase protein
LSEAIYQEALEAYVNPFHEFTVEPMGAGLINQSYRITSQYSGESFLLQMINKNVFPEPEKVQYNYELIWKFLSEEQKDLYLPEPKYFTDTDSLFVDSKNNYWRVFEFIYGSYTPEKFTAKQARSAAKVFAWFTSSLAGFVAEDLEIVIPGFHDLGLRFKQFKTALHSGEKERITNAEQLIEELTKRERYASLHDVFIESDEFPKRVMHHDAKISNVLFDTDTDNLVSLVDFDTVMPGYFFSDLGDMIRTMACPVDEASTEFNKIAIRKTYYQAIIGGYTSFMEDDLTTSEKKYIHYSGLIMIYMQALRFLADYLNGDVYYKIKYPGQNFDRAKNQWALLVALEKFLKENYSFNS